MPLGIGAWIYRLRRRFRGGVRATWFRERVCPKILLTPSILLPLDSRYEIHMLTSAGDWLLLMWALKSWFHCADETAAVCIHEDGTLTDKMVETLETHFPGARIIRRTDADREVLAGLAEFPWSKAFRNSNNLALKVFDTIHYANADRLLLLDSDVLFFRRPAHLLDVLRTPDATNWFNRDVADAYTADRSHLEAAFGFPVVKRFNSGLCVLDRKSLDLATIERFLPHDSLNGHFWRIEQTLFALCSSQYGAQSLPEGYDVTLTPGVLNRVCKHYVGVIRNDMYREGMRHLAREGFLKSIDVTLRQPEAAEVAP